MIDYSRNMLFIPEEMQSSIRNKTLLICGVGIGSVFAELALRTGFRDFIIADGDKVSNSNLNRQNYTGQDVGISKVSSLERRLKEIDPEVQITKIERYLSEDDLRAYIPRVDFVINTIDFDCSEFVLCRNICREHKVPELFPINLGFGTGVCMFDENSPGWELLGGDSDHIDLKRNILKKLYKSEHIAAYLKEAGDRYFSEEKPLTLEFDPQLAVSASLSSVLMVSLILQYLSDKSQVSYFPNFYYQDGMKGILIK